MLRVYYIIERMVKVNIVQEIENFLKQNENSGALLVTGKWGCGKTYLLNKIAEENNKKAQNEENIIVSISLFGIDSISMLHQRVKEKVAFAKNFNVKAINIIKNWNKIKKAASPIILAAKESSIVAKSINAVLSIEWFDFISIEKNIDCFVNGQRYQKKLVLVFDDFERSKINTIDLLGAINYYSEAKDIKVIIIANEDKIGNKTSEEYKAVKEKIVFRTLNMALDNENIVNNVISLYNETERDYKNFLIENNSIIKQVFLNSGCENIRSLKSILANFERIYGAWLKTDIPLKGNIEKVLYQFAAIAFESRAGNFTKCISFYIIKCATDGEEQSKKKEIENKYEKDTFNNYIVSMVKWIVDGEWDEELFKEEIKKKYAQNDIKAEDKFIYYKLWDLQQSDIEEGMPIILHRAYKGEACCDELIALLQKVHTMKLYKIPLPEEIDYNKIKNGFDTHRSKIRNGSMKEPRRYTFSEENQLDPEAVDIYKEIEKLDYQISTWENRNQLILYLEDKNEVSQYDLKNKVVDSFDDSLLDLFADRYNKSTNAKRRELSWVIGGIDFYDFTFSTKNDMDITKNNLKRLSEKVKEIADLDIDKISVAISESFIEELNEKSDKISKIITDDDKI